MIKVISCTSRYMYDSFVMNDGAMDGDQLVNTKSCNEGD